MFVRSGLILTCLFFALFAQAQTDTQDFYVRVVGGADTEPPTTPTLLTIEPVAANQIDITWSPSTDNVIVGGYLVLRDGLPVATTTQTNYSDNGLMASTTYSYAVRAFDPSLNYSTSSNILATTTFDLPPPPPPGIESISRGSETEGTAVRVVLDDVRIVSGNSTSSLGFTTARPARLEVRWGRTTAYELGYVVSDVFSREHEILLTDLEPGTTYEYQVIGYTPRGNSMVVLSDQFITTASDLENNPSNVYWFEALQDGTNVQLRWELPTNESILQVRVVRSHFGFPDHPQAGSIVYQGSGQQAVDVGVLLEYSPVYYTAFVYDTEGNVSSGAIAMVYRRGDSGGVYPTNEVVIMEEGGASSSVVLLPELSVISEPTTTIDVAALDFGVNMPGLHQLEIVQGYRYYTFIDPVIELDILQNIIVSIPRDSVPAHLKTIIVSVMDVTDNRRAQSYLLRLNRDQTAYEAVIAAPRVEGRSQMQIAVYDFEQSVVGTYQTPVQFVVSKNESKREAVLFPDILYRTVNIWILPLIFIVAPLLLILLLRRRGEDNL